MNYFLTINSLFSLCFFGMISCGKNDRSTLQSKAINLGSTTGIEIDINQFSDFNFHDLNKMAWENYLLAHANDPNLVASGGNLVGNGGDPLYHLFDKARHSAASAIAAYAADLDPTSLATETLTDSNKFDKFINDLHQAMQASVLRSPHLWIVEANLDPQIKIQPTCALTNVVIDGKISNSLWFALETCRTLLSGNDAFPEIVKMLIHESSHHFSTHSVYGEHSRSEPFAIEVASKIYEHWISTRFPDENNWLAIANLGLSARQNHSATSYKYHTKTNASDPTLN